MLQGLSLTRPARRGPQSFDYQKTWPFAYYSAANSGALVGPWNDIRRTGSATYIDAAGLVAVLPDLGGGRYMPRLTYNPSTRTPEGMLIEGQATEEINSHSLASPQMVTQTVTVTAAQRTISFYGTGTITLSGAHVAVVTGTGAYPTRTSLTFTPSAAPLVMTVAGTVQYPQMILGAVTQSYIPNPGTGTTVRVADWTGPGVVLTGAALAAAFPAGVAQPFTGVFKYRKAYSAASDETLFALSAGTTFATTNGLALQTNGTEAKLTTSAGDGTATGTLVHDGVTVNRIAYSVDPTYRGAELVTNGDFATNTWWLLSASGTGTATIAGGKLTLTSVGVDAAVAYKPILTIGKQYAITVDVVVRSGSVKVEAGSAAQIISATGTYNFSLKCAGDTNLYLSRNATGTCDADFDNVSVKEAGAMSLSVNGATAVQTTGTGYTGVGTTSLIPGSQTTGGSEPVTQMEIADWNNAVSGSYITGAALAALSA
jgi:hypothetical protein